MKIFISWSGNHSNKIAAILKEWIPSVMQSVEPFVSSEDIDKGSRWSNDIANELKGSKYGVICLTPENLNAPWLNFEAGALSKAMDESRVSPFLVGLKPSDLKGPILQFQATLFNKNDLWKLVQSINDFNTDFKMEKDRLKSTFDVWFPKLENELNLVKEKILSNQTSSKPEQQDSKQPKAKRDDILEEILSLNRIQLRHLNNRDELTLKLQEGIEKLYAPGKDYEDFRLAFQAIHTCVEESIQNHPKRPQGNIEITLKLLAVAMTFSWKNFICHSIPLILRKYPDVKIALEILFVDSEYLDQLSISEHETNWVKESKQRIVDIEEYCKTIVVEFEDRLQFHARTYKNLPHWHGWMIGKEHLFLGRTKWLFDNELPRLSVGQNEYRYFNSSERKGKERIHLFSSWYQFYSNHFSEEVHCSLGSSLTKPNK